MRFLVDESCDFAVVRALRGASHDVVAVVEVARGAKDAAVLTLSRGEGRILLTEDKDFGQLVFADGGGAAGVVFGSLSRFGPRYPERSWTSCNDSENACPHPSPCWSPAA